MTRPRGPLGPKIGPLTLAALLVMTGCQAQGPVVLKTRNLTLGQQDFLQQEAYFDAIKQAKELLDQDQDTLLPDASLDAAAWAAEASAEQASKEAASADSAEAAEGADAKGADAKDTDAKNAKDGDDAKSADDAKDKDAASEEASSLVDPLEVKEQEEAQEKADAEKRAYLTSILRTLAYEEVVKADINKQGLDVGSRLLQLREEAEAKLGGPEGVQSQLENAKIPKELWEEALTRQARAQVHRENFERQHPVDEESLKKYARLKGKEAYLLTFIDVTVPTRFIAVDLEESLAADEINVEDLDNRFNHDLFERTSFQMVRDVGKGDSAVFDSGLYAQEPGTVVRYYYDDLYHVVKMLERKTDFSEIRGHVEQLYMDDSYLRYVNQLARDQGLKIYPEQIPGMPVQDNKR